MHFSETIKLQLIKNAICHFVFQHFLELLFLTYLSKMHGYPQFSLWIPTALAKMCYSHIVISCAKNLSCISRHCPKTINFELSIFNQVSALCLFLCGKRSVLLQTSKHVIAKGARLRIFVFNFQGTLYTGLADGRIVRLEGDKVIEVVRTGKPPCGKLVPSVH